MSIILESNLRALEPHNESIVRRLRETVPADVVFALSGQEVPVASYQGAQLASRHRPLDEAQRWADGIDIAEHATVAVLGFGLGYHVQRLAERMLKTGIIIVFEPGLALLRAVLERVDHSAWLRRTNIALVADPADRADLSRSLAGLEGIVTQGTTIVEHPASRRRLGAQGGVFSKTLAEVVSAMRTTILTTLVHSTTTCRNLCLNLDRYAGGEGIAPLKGWAAGYPAILFAAGPSLSVHLNHIAPGLPGEESRTQEDDQGRTGVFPRQAGGHVRQAGGHVRQAGDNVALRDRAVLIAVQTALKPLLARGIRPHFVTALDYHEISRQFYEGLTADDVRGVTLICEPKVNRSVIESWPGAVRCVGNAFLDRLLGPLRRDMGSVTAGATVAHLSFYLAQYFGCDPIVFVGQDLGFTDALYYGPGAAIHEQWGPELNPFNTIEMMEWQRIARMKRNLRDAPGHGGRTILTDEQMSTYFQQFERDFAAAPQRILDATPGGTLKRHTQPKPLTDVLAELPSRSLPEMPMPREAPDGVRLDAVRQRLDEVRQRIERLRDLSRETAGVLEQMLDHQRDRKRMERLFRQVDRQRQEVERLGEAFDLVNLLNQLGAFKRLKADRRLELAADLDPLARQRAQIERDLVNVQWLADAAQEMATVLDEARAVLDGGRVDPRITNRSMVALPGDSDPTGPTDSSGPIDSDPTALIDSGPTHFSASSCTDSKDILARIGPRPKRRIAAILAVDPHQSGLLLPRRLDERFLGRSVLQATLERLGRCRRIESIVLIVPREFDVEPLIDRDRIGRPIVVHPVDEPIHDESHRAVAIARRWSDTSWRGGIGGMTIYDEAIAPVHMLRAMEEHDLQAVVVAGPDWPLIDFSEQTGCDALVARHLEQPESHRLVFTQAPPGLCGCLVERSLMREMAGRARQFTLGSMLAYIPSIPQLDPITKDACVKLPATVRNDLGRYTFDTPDRRSRLRDLCARHGEFLLDEASEKIIAACGFAIPHSESDNSPQFLEIDLSADEDVFPFEEILEHIDRLAAHPDAALTLCGDDPLDHPRLADILRHARDAGITAIHLRTNLIAPPHLIDELLDLRIDVISVNLNADRAETYRRVTGTDRFGEVIANLERLINGRNQRTGDANRLQLPWIVPRIVRCEATLPDLLNFFDRWVHLVGAAVIDSVDRETASSDPEGRLRLRDSDVIPVFPPPHVLQRETQRTKRIGGASPSSARGSREDAVVIAGVAAPLDVPML